MSNCIHDPRLTCRHCPEPARLEPFEVPQEPFGDIFAPPGLSWFCQQRKPVQMFVGIPIVVGLLWACAVELWRKRDPGAPQQAFLFNLILLLVVVVLGELLRPDPAIEDARPAGLGDFQFPTATEGRIVPLLWGRVRVRGPNVVWYGDLQVEAQSKFFKSGLWSGKRIITGFKYFIGVQFAICRGPGCVLKKVWVDEDIVFTGSLAVDGDRFDIDEPELFGGEEYGHGGIEATVDFYTGSKTQPVSIYLEAVGRQLIQTAPTSTAPRYTGTCYLVAREMTGLAPTVGDEGAYFGTSTTIKPWSFEIERFPALFSGQGGSQNKVGVDDANPVNVLYELLTDTEWGFGYSDSKVDVGTGSSFLAASLTMITEVNGWSMFLDRAMQADDLKVELERQMGAIVFEDQSTGKWTITLIRADYTIGTVLQLDETNVKEVQDFTRGSWEDTTNQVQVKYSKRGDDYKESHAVAQDQANAIISSGGNALIPVGVVSSSTYPGVKYSALASNLAWRDLRALSFPMARCVLVVNRVGWAVRIGDVVAWTNTKFGFSQLAMRVVRVDYGTLTTNEISIQLVQDVFFYAVASMGTPANTGWVSPSVSLVAYPTGEQLAFESPRAIVTRDPDYSGDPNIAKVLCSARNQSGEVAFNITQRNASGTPAGSYADAGDVVAFVRVGKLTSAISAGVANPTASILISADPDSQTRLEEVFIDTSTTVDLGVDLAQILMVGNEFMLVTSASVSGLDVALANVYRGALDSAQENHLINAPVFLLFVGAGLTDTAFVNTHNVDVELRSKSTTQTFADSVTPIAIALDKRSMRPYPPAAALYNGSVTPFAGIDVDADGTGLNGTGFDVDWWRRSLDGTNEVAGLLSDDTGVDASLEHRVRVFVNPATTNDEVFTGAWTTGTGAEFVNRLNLWDKGAAGSQIRIQIEARHDILTEVNLVSRYNLIHDVVPTSSTYDGLFYLGGDLRANVSSTTYSAAATGTFTVRIGASYGTSNVEVNVNGAGFVVEIAAGGTTGTFSATSGQSIVVRHTFNETPSLNHVELENPSAVLVAYGVLND